MAATSARRFNSLDTVESMEQQDDVTVASSEDKKTFVLYDKDDDKHINAVHNIVRRDIWEGFVVDTRSKDLKNGDVDKSFNVRRSG